mgnify:CR=1 FL=1
MSLVSSANVLLAERKSRTLQRLMTTSLQRWQILAGHGLGMLVLTLLQVLLLVVFGQLVLGAAYFRAPLATLLVSLAIGLWIASMGLLIGLLAKDDSQVVLFALLAMFILVLLVLLSSRLFSTASQTFNTGIRKAEINLVGRSVLDFLDRDISRAVFYTNSAGRLGTPESSGHD